MCGIVHPLWNLDFVAGTLHSSAWHFLGCGQEEVTAPGACGAELALPSASSTSPAKALLHHGRGAAVWAGGLAVGGLSKGSLTVSPSPPHSLARRETRGERRPE